MDQMWQLMASLSLIFGLVLIAMSNSTVFILLGVAFVLGAILAAAYYLSIEEARTI